MNRNQKLVIGMTAVLASLILHFSFCRWEFGTIYGENAWGTGRPLHLEVAGWNSADWGGRFYGLAAKDSKALAVLFGIVTPVLLLGGAATLALKK